VKRHDFTRFLERRTPALCGPGCLLLRSATTGVLIGAGCPGNQLQETPPWLLKALQGFCFAELLLLIAWSRDLE